MNSTYRNAPNSINLQPTQTHEKVLHAPNSIQFCTLHLLTLSSDLFSPASLRAVCCRTLATLVLTFDVWSCQHSVRAPHELVQVPPFPRRVDHDEKHAPYLARAFSTIPWESQTQTNRCHKPPLEVLIFSLESSDLSPAMNLLDGVRRKALLPKWRGYLLFQPRRTQRKSNHPFHFCPPLDQDPGIGYRRYTVQIRLTSNWLSSLPKTLLASNLIASLVKATLFPTSWSKHQLESFLSNQPPLQQVLERAFDH
mmetsp:Transcript_60529/g.95376  ORF Transcript_60529/g.95376 Transcript_60529/m.95376 type:complete len:253 (+) Transcript_60529:191-949(+)